MAVRRAAARPQADEGVAGALASPSRTRIWLAPVSARSFAIWPLGWLPEPTVQPGNHRLAEFDQCRADSVVARPMDEEHAEAGRNDLVVGDARRRLRGLSCSDHRGECIDAASRRRRRPGKSFRRPGTGPRLRCGSRGHARSVGVGVLRACGPAIAPYPGGGFLRKLRTSGFHAAKDLILAGAAVLLFLRRARLSLRRVRPRAGRHVRPRALRRSGLRAATAWVNASAVGLERLPSQAASISFVRIVSAARRSFSNFECLAIRLLAGCGKAARIDCGRPGAAGQGALDALRASALGTLLDVELDLLAAREAVEVEG